jgi:hypothetical protein
MKRILLIAAVVAAVCMVAYAGYSTLIYTEQGGSKMVVSSGGEIEIQSGATFDMDGTYEIGSDLTLANSATIGNTPDGDIVLTEAGEDLRLRFTSNNVELLSRLGVLGLDVNDLYIVFNEISAPTGNPASDLGWLYTKDATGTTTLYFEDSAGTVTDLLAAGSGNTLDQSYDQGGAGSGRTIDADTGAVAITVSNTDNNTGLIVTQNDTTNNDDAVQIVNAGTGISLDIDGVAGGDDIQGTGDTWAVTGAGAAQFTTIAGTGITTTSATVSLGDGTTTAAVNSSAWDISTAGAVSGVTTIGMSGDLTNSGGDLIVANGNGLKGSTTNAETLDISAYDVDGAAYVATIALTNGNTIAAAVGTGVETVAVDSTTWDVSTAGVFTGVTGITNAGALNQNEDVAISLDATDEEVVIATSAQVAGAGTPVVLIESTNADVTTQGFLLELQYTDNGDADADFMVMSDNNGGTDLVTFSEGGSTTWTLDAASELVIDADTTDTTTTAGVVDIDVGTATDTAAAFDLKVVAATGNGETVTGVRIDVDDDTTDTGTLRALSIGSSDSTPAGGSTTVDGIAILTGVDVGVTMALDAASVGMTIDAATANNTGTAGILDFTGIITESTQAFMNLEIESESNGAAEEMYGLYVQTDDDADNADSEIHAFHAATDGVNGTGLQHGFVQSGANADAGLYLKTGYLRVGTGSSADETLGADTGYFEGTIEADGIIYADAGVQIDNTTLLTATVELSNANVEALQGTPIELVAAPAAGSLLEFVSAIIVLDYGGAALTETADNLAIEYDNGSGVQVSIIESTGFIDQGADTITRAIASIDPIDAAADIVAKNLAILNVGDGEFGNGGAATSTMTVIITYRLHDTLGL